VLHRVSVGVCARSTLSGGPGQLDTRMSLWAEPQAAGWHWVTPFDTRVVLARFEKVAAGALTGHPNHELP